MTWFRWWHRHVRLLVKPKSEEDALLWSRRLSLIYAFAGWNIFGIALYNLRRKRELTESEKNLSLSPGQILAKEMGRENAQVMTLKGLRLIPVNPQTRNEHAENEELTQ